MWSNQSKSEWGCLICEFWTVSIDWYTGQSNDIRYEWVRIYVIGIVNIYTYSILHEEIIQKWEQIYIRICIQHETIIQKCMSVKYIYEYTTDIK